MRILTTIIISVFALVLHAQNEVKLIFTGEVNVGNNYATRYQQQINAEKLFVNVTDELKSGTATFGTLGTVLIDVEGTPNKANIIGTRKLIRMSSEYATSLAKSGYSALSLANVHVSDFGVEGVQTTMNAMQANQIEFAGLKSMQDYAIFDRGGLRFGFIAFGSSVHTLSMSDSTNIRQLIAGLDDQCDIVIVAFSFNETVNSMQNDMNPAINRNVFLTNAMSFAHTCIDAGADVVYGNGHNLPQPLELYKDKLIIYGLGNFCTPYGVSYTGELGAAPVIEANLFAEGTFKDGKIVSYRQQRTATSHKRLCRLRIMARLSPPQSRSMLLPSRYCRKQRYTWVSATDMARKVLPRSTAQDLRGLYLKNSVSSSTARLQASMSKEHLLTRRTSVLVIWCSSLVRQFMVWDMWASC